MVISGFDKAMISLDMGLTKPGPMHMGGIHLPADDMLEIFINSVPIRIADTLTPTKGVWPFPIDMTFSSEDLTPKSHSASGPGADYECHLVDRQAREIERLQADLQHRDAECTRLWGQIDRLKKDLDTAKEVQDS